MVDPEGERQRAALLNEVRMSTRVLADAAQDLRFALRQMRRAPAVTSLIVVTLALGIGANVTMFGAIERLLLRPPPHVREPANVVRVLFQSTEQTGRRGTATVASYPTLVDFRRDVTAFESVAGYSVMNLSLGAGAEAVEVRAAVVSASYFRVLGVNPLLGRVFDEGDGFPSGEGTGGPALAVLSDELWRREYAADRQILGRSIRIGSTSYTIVGVLPAGFRGVESESPEVWLPISVAAATEAPSLWFAGRGSTWISIVARLQYTASRALASKQATQSWQANNVPFGAVGPPASVVAASIIPGRGPDMPREAKVMLWLAGVSTLVLLIACANVANLLIGRAFARRREISVRLALGATSGRLARQMVTEAFLLAALGGGAAAYVAFLGGGLLDKLLLRGGGGSADIRQIALTAVVALGTGILISLAPLAQSTNPDLASALRAGVTVGGGRTSRLRAALLATQASVSMLLLVGAALFGESLRRIEGLDLGIDRDHTLLVRFDLSQYALPTPTLDGIYQEIQRRVRAVPGVTRVAWAEKNPYRNGRAVAAHSLSHDADFYWHVGVMQAPMQAAVDSGFFRTVGATLRGRDFSSSDGAGEPRVAIVNEPLAALLWPGEEAVGQCMLTSFDPTDRACVTVVGVVRGFFRRDILERDQYLVYVPLAQSSVRRPAGLFIAVSRDANAIAPAVRRAFQSVRSDLPAVSIASMYDLLEPEMKPWRLAATMFSAFGGLALLIAVVGLYGVVATNATSRATELAVRIALGARAGHVLSAVAGDGLRAVGFGLAIGIATSLSVSRWLASLLFATSATDPWIIGGVSTLLFGVAIVACLIPTWRVLRLGPASVLRTD